MQYKWMREGIEGKGLPNNVLNEVEVLLGYFKFNFHKANSHRNSKSPLRRILDLPNMRSTSYMGYREIFVYISQHIQKKN